MLTNMIRSLSIALALYLGVSFTLIWLPFNGSVPQSGLDFDVLDTTDLNQISPAPQIYTSRDGATLSYREFSGSGETVLILLHGSGTEGRYLSPLADFLQQTLNATVLVPDLRGHGFSKLGTPGDLDHLSQLEHDIEDLLLKSKSEHPNKRFYLIGHSSGGGLALKVAANQHPGFAGYVLLAPFLGYNAPTIKPVSKHWVNVHLTRYAGISMLNRVGIDALNHKTVMVFGRPLLVEDDLQVSSYSYRMSQAFSPVNYTAELQAVDKPLLLLIGQEDEAFVADAFTTVLDSHAPNAQLKVLQGIKHLNIVTHESTYSALEDWLRPHPTKADIDKSPSSTM